MLQDFCFFEDREQHLLQNRNRHIRVRKARGCLNWRGLAWHGQAEEEYKAQKRRNTRVATFWLHKWMITNAAGRLDENLLGLFNCSQFPFTTHKSPYAVLDQKIVRASLHVHSPKCVSAGRGGGGLCKMEWKIPPTCCCLQSLLNVHGTRIMAKTQSVATGTAHKLKLDESARVAPRAWRAT
jgi:hypothetical protein